jgi:HD domain
MGGGKSPIRHGRTRGDVRSYANKMPEARLAPYYSDLWLLAGLISIADWIGSNEIMVLAGAWASGRAQHAFERARLFVKLAGRAARAAMELTR